MRIGFLLYGELETITGGFLYDRMLVDYLRKQGDDVEVFSLPWVPWAPALLFNASFSLLRRLRRLSPDLILEDELAHPSLFMLNRRIHRNGFGPLVAVVHHLRSLETGPTRRKRMVRGIEERFLDSVDGFIFNSRATLHSVLPRKKRTPAWVVAPPGGDRFGITITEEEVAMRPRRSGPLALLFVGSLIPRKGLRTLIAALALLDSGNWHLTVVGNRDRDARYGTALQKQIAAGRLDGRITFTGEIGDADLVSLFRTSQVLAVPSFLEGFGIVYLEAMGFGLPAIASSAGGASEIVIHGRNGFLVAPGDVGALASSIGELIQNRERLLEMSLAARRTFLGHPTWADGGRMIYDFLHHFET